MLGAKRILKEYGVSYVIIDEKEIADTINNYHVLLFFSHNFSFDCFASLNKFMKRGGCLIFIGKLDSQYGSLFHLRIKENINPAKIQLKLGNNNPIIYNIKNRDIIITCEATLIDEYKEYETVGKFIYDNDEYPAIIINKHKNLICFPFDICRQVTLWENEQYSKPKEKTSFENFIIKKYYGIPFRFRKVLKSGIRKIRSLLSKNRTIYTKCPFEYNSDTIRLLLFNSIIYLSLNTTGFLPTLSKWPNNLKGAMVITHDIDTNEDYKKGLPILLKIEKKYNLKTTWFFVARSAEYDVEAEILSDLISNGYEIASHGLYHDMKCDEISDEMRLERISECKKIIENKMRNYKVSGFRSPGLARNFELWPLLENIGYEYDMSYPDNDHYTLSHFGLGVSSHIPYNPIIKYGCEYKELNILELPLAALQEANVFIDHKMDDKIARKLWIRKCESIIEDEGLVVFLFHPSIFISESKIQMYEFLIKYFSGKNNLWITTSKEVVDWWNRRKLVNIFTKYNEKNGYEIEIHNSGTNPIEKLTLKIYIKKDTKIEIKTGSKENITFENLEFYDICYVNITHINEMSKEELIISFEE